MGKQLGSTLDIPQVATPSASPAAARQLLYAKSDGKLYTKTSAGTEALIGPSGEYTATTTGGTATYLRLATLDGQGASTGASFTAIISGSGNFGNANRGTTLLHVGQRGADAYIAKAWAFGNATALGPHTYLVKQISTYVFEVWANRTTFDAAFGMQVLSKWNTTVNFDSESTTAPTGTLNPVTNTDMDTALAGKEPLFAAGTGTQYYRGDKTWQTLNAAAVANAMSLDTQQTITALKLFQARLRSGFNTNVVQTPLTTSAAEFELSANSMITLGESVAGDANPALTFYRTSAGLRTGQALRQMYQANGPLRWQLGNATTYGAETYTDLMTLTNAGALGVTTVNGQFVNAVSAVGSTLMSVRQSGASFSSANPAFDILTDNATAGSNVLMRARRSVTEVFRLADTGDITSPGTLNIGILNPTTLLAQNKGGTGQSAFNFPYGLIYQSGSSAMLVSSPTGTAGQALISGGAAAPVAWQTLMLSDIPDAWVKRSVKAASLPPSGNVVIATGGTAVTVDGISVAAGDRVLLKDQTITSQNGIYQVNAGAWTRAADADAISEIAGAAVNIDQGTQGGQLWNTTIKPTDTLGATAMYWYRLLDTSQLGVANGAASLDAAGKVPIAQIPRLDLIPQPQASVQMNNQKLTGLGYPTGVNDGVNKSYIDDLTTHPPARAASTPASGNLGTYAPNAPADSGSGTMSGMPTSIDGVTLAANDRVLLKDQTDQRSNGLWYVVTLGTGADGQWGRPPDWYWGGGGARAGAQVVVEEGTVNADTGWVVSSNNPHVVDGTTGTNFTWVAFGGSGSGGGSGLVPTQPGAPANPVDGQLWYDDDDTGVVPGTGDTGWISSWVNATGSDTGWTLGSVAEARYRVLNGWVEVRLRTVYTGAGYGPFVSGNYTNNQIGSGLPAAVCPDANTNGQTHLRETNVVCVLTAAGSFVIVGGAPNLTFSSGDLFNGSWVYSKP